MRQSLAAGIDDMEEHSAVHPRITRLTVQRQLQPHHQQQQQLRAEDDRRANSGIDPSTTMSSTSSRQRPSVASTPTPPTASTTTTPVADSTSASSLLPSEHVYRIGSYSIDKQTLRLGINLVFVLIVTTMLLFYGSTYQHGMIHRAHPEYDSLNQLSANTHAVLVNHHIRHPTEEDHEIPVGYFQYVSQHALPEVQMKIDQLEGNKDSQIQEEGQHIETFITGWVSGLVERYNIKHYEQIDAMIDSVPVDNTGVEQMLHRGILQCQTKSCQQLHQHIKDTFIDKPYIQQYYTQPSTHTQSLPTDITGVYEWLGHYFSTGNDRYLLPLIEIAHTNTKDSFHILTRQLLQSYADQPSHSNIRDLLHLQDDSNIHSGEHEEL